MIHFLPTLGRLVLLAARSALYMGIALLALAVCRLAAAGAFTILHHLMGG